MTTDFPLRSYQESALSFALAKTKSLVALDMGLGKTRVALEASASMAPTGSTIVICPAYVKTAWRKQIELWTPYIKYQVLSAKSEPIDNQDIYIVNYDILDRFDRFLSKIDKKLVILDESQYVKNKKTQRYKLCRSIIRSSPFRILLTGTPMESRPSELCAQLDILDQLHAFGGEWMFKKRHCVKSHHTGTLTCGHEACMARNAKGYPKACKPCPGWQSCYCGKDSFGYWDFSGASNLKELNTKLREVCMYRKTKEEAALDLPPFERKIIYLEQDNKNVYDVANGSFIQWVKDNQGDEAARAAFRAEAIVKMNTLKILSARGKIISATKWIKDYFENGKKLVVFTWHTEIVNGLLQYFNEEMSGCVYSITGETEAENERPKVIEEFSNNPRPSLLISNIKAGGLGIDLTAASDCLFLELAWTPTAHDQAESRLSRFGQTKPVTAYYAFCDGTIDIYNYKMLGIKRNLINAAIDGKTFHDQNIDVELETARHIYRAGVESEQRGDANQ